MAVSWADTRDRYRRGIPTAKFVVVGRSTYSKYRPFESLVRYIAKPTISEALLSYRSSLTTERRKHTKNRRACAVRRRQKMVGE